MTSPLDYPFAPGETVANCLLIQELGTGSFGQVWKVTNHGAKNDSAEPYTALKLIHKQRDFNAEDWRTRGKWLSNIRHSAIVKVLRGGTFTDGPYARFRFIEMEYIEGRSLARPNTPDPDFVLMLRPVAQAIDLLHKGTWSGGLPLVFRDIKPANMILRPDNTLVLVDPDGIRDVTDYEQTLYGTRNYQDQNPEVAGISSPETDLYSFAATMAALLTGERGMGFNRIKEDPFAYELPDVLQKMLARGCSDPHLRERFLRDPTLPLTCSQLVEQVAIDYSLTISPQDPTTVEATTDGTAVMPVNYRDAQTGMLSYQESIIPDNSPGHRFNRGRAMGPSRGMGRGPGNRGGYDGPFEERLAKRSANRRQDHYGRDVLASHDYDAYPPDSYPPDNSPPDNPRRNAYPSDGPRFGPPPRFSEPVYDETEYGGSTDTTPASQPVRYRVWPTVWLAMLLASQVAILWLASPQLGYIDVSLSLALFVITLLLNIVTHLATGNAIMAFILPYAWGSLYGITSGSPRHKWVRDVISGFFTVALLLPVGYVLWINHFNWQLTSSFLLTEFTNAQTQAFRYIVSSYVAIVWLFGELVLWLGRNGGLFFWLLRLPLLPFELLGGIPRKLLGG